MLAYFFTVRRHVLLCLLLIGIIVAHSPIANSNPEVAIEQFITHMQQTHHMDEQPLRDLFAQVTVREDILLAISTPAERTKPWHEYRELFISPQQIQRGITYWQEHADILHAAQQQYGVPAEIIVAILGVETRWGRITGSYPVIDALTTLAFHYPPRGDFFRSELEHFLLLIEEEQAVTTTSLGSYAGAMGQAQFIPSSYRHYSVDFSETGTRDLFHSNHDIIASIANYLASFAWQADEPIVIAADASSANISSEQSTSLELNTTIAQWQQQGVQPKDAPANTIDKQQPALYIALQQPNHVDVYLGLHNFSVITRYNRSRLYAFAVYELAQSIKAQYQQQVAQEASAL